MPEPEGKTFVFDSEEKINPELLEVFKFDDVALKVQITSDEFSAVCPFSGLPDIARVRITYYPQRKVCLELKSLKYYLNSFRTVGIYQESVTKRIYDDLQKILKTSRIKVETTYNTRGGIDVVCQKGTIERPEMFYSDGSFLSNIHKVCHVPPK